MKKVLSILFAVIMLLSLSMTAFAAEVPADAGTNILVDDSQYRIVESFGGGQRFVATYNKVDNTVSLVSYNADDEILHRSVTNLNNSTVSTLDEYGVATAANSISKYTESLYAYIKTYGNPNEWELRRPEYLDEPSSTAFYFKTEETSVNEDDLSGFQTAVNSMYTLEGQLKSAIGTANTLAVIAGASAGIGGPVGWGAAAAAFIAALGFDNSAQNYAYQIEEQQIIAWDCYYEVYYNSDIYF